MDEQTKDAERQPSEAAWDDAALQRTLTALRDLARLMHSNGGMPRNRKSAAAVLYGAANFIESIVASRQTPSGEAGRVPINIAPETRDKLHALLMTERFARVGYTAFVEMAIAALSSRSAAAVPTPGASGLREAVEKLARHEVQTLDEDEVYAYRLADDDEALEAGIVEYVPLSDVLALLDAARRSSVGASEPTVPDGVDGIVGELMPTDPTPRADAPRPLTAEERREYRALKSQEVLDVGSRAHTRYLELHARAMAHRRVVEDQQLARAAADPALTEPTMQTTWDALVADYRARKASWEASGRVWPRPAMAAMPVCVTCGKPWMPRSQRPAFRPDTAPRLCCCETPIPATPTPATRAVETATQSASPADSCRFVLKRLADDADAAGRDHIALTPAEARDIARRIRMLETDDTAASECLRMVRDVLALALGDDTMRATPPMMYPEAIRAAFRKVAMGELPDEAYPDGSLRHQLATVRRHAETVQQAVTQAVAVLEGASAADNAKPVALRITNAISIIRRALHGDDDGDDDGVAGERSL